MIKLIFEVRNQLFIIIINGREIFYQDKNTKNKIRIIPQDPQLKRLVILSRNRIPNSVLEMANLNEEEKKEYENCSNEEELSEVCIKDCKNKYRAKLINKEILWKIK